MIYVFQKVFAFCKITRLIGKIELEADHSKLKQLYNKNTNKKNNKPNKNILTHTQKSQHLGFKKTTVNTGILLLKKKVYFATVKKQRET